MKTTPLTILEINDQSFVKTSMFPVNMKRSDLKKSVNGSIISVQIRAKNDVLKLCLGCG